MPLGTKYSTLDFEPPVESLNSFCFEDELFKKQHSFTMFDQAEKGPLSHLVECVHMEEGLSLIDL